MGHGRLAIVWLIVGLILGLIAGRYVGAALRRRAEQPAPFVHCEYWVYLPTDKMPSQDELMTLLATGDALGPQELLLFSDIRLDIGLVRRKANPHVFRPDLFFDHAEPNAAMLRFLAESPAMVRARYISTEAILDDRHARLLPYLAYGLAKLGHGEVVYDAVAEELLATATLVERLKSDKRLAEPASHTRVVWMTEPVGGHAETRGLIKRGLPELSTEPVHSDERVVVTSILQEAIAQLWGQQRLPTSLDVNLYGDTFRLMLSPSRKGPAKVRILREQSA